MYIINIYEYQNNSKKYEIHIFKYSKTSFE